MGAVVARGAAALSRGRRGTWRHARSFCVAAVALLTHGWVWWRAWVPLVARDAAALLRGRRGTWRHRLAGVALGDTHLRFAWQVWHLWDCMGWVLWRAWVRLVGALGSAWSPGTPRRAFAWQAWRLATWTCVLRGRRGASGTVLALVACHT